MRKTRIIATIGPACSDRDTLEEIIEAGADGFRLNYSHGTQESRQSLITEARAAIEASDREIALIQDLTGPRIRTAQVEGSGEIELETGQSIILEAGDHTCTVERIGIQPARAFQDIRQGDRVFIDEGMIQIKAESIEEKRIEGTVVRGGTLSSNKGVNLPDSKLSSLPALTRKDRKDLEEASEVGFDAVMQSFVRREEDVLGLRDCLEDWDSDPLVIAKIETAEVLDHLEELARQVDYLLVARGDLGAEIHLEKVPGTQKRIVEIAHRYDAGVITATQMLESMIERPMPTRAEVSDVSNAILEGTGAVMLSGETAAGNHPVKTVECMDRIARTTEEDLFPFGSERFEIMSGWRPYLRASVKGGLSMARELHADAIGVFTRSGTTALLTAQHRPRADILAFSARAPLRRQLNLCWGVTPIPFTYPDRLEKMFQRAMEKAVELGYLSEGDVIVFIAGTQRAVESENLVTVREV